MSSFESIICFHCKTGFNTNEDIINASGDTYHSTCFVCAHCFCNFENGIFYEFEKRKYCESDFKLLYAPCCKFCGEYIDGRVIKALNSSWHPSCFKCNSCGINLAESGFLKSGTNTLCRRCHNEDKLKSGGNATCNKCFTQIEDDLLRFKGDVYHAHHFNCKSCGKKLNSSARELKNELFCVRCYDKMQIAICSACKQPIDNERVLNALGKQWHIEHFACSHCEKPFLGSLYYEKENLAYCELDYKLLFGNRCFICNCVSTGDEFTAWNKCWCSNHFSCYLCDEKMDQKTKFYGLDYKPICKKCFEKLPSKIKSTISKANEKEAKSLNILWKKEK